MIKKYAFVNLLFSPLHGGIIATLAMGLFMLGEKGDWVELWLRAVHALFWGGLIPNFYYLWKYRRNESNVKSFLFSSLILYLLYLGATYLLGWWYFTIYY